jgi:hypothetical protein
MKKALLISLLFFNLIFWGCKNIAMKMAGIRNPEIESKNTILGFLLKINQDTNDVYTFDTVLFKKYMSEPFKPGWPNGLRPAQIRVYNKFGEPVMQWSSCEGFLKDLKTFDSVPPKNFNGLNTSLNLQEDLKQYFTLDGVPANIVLPTNYDYYILIYFAKWYQKLSKESFTQVENYKQKHPELSIKVYKISTDFQANWGWEPQFISE